MSQDYFLSPDNNCGQTILKLVSRGNAIIAELLRLSQFIPPVFKLETKDDQDKYKNILPDFHYFECPDLYENKIDGSPVCQQWELVFAESCSSQVVNMPLIFAQFRLWYFFLSL